MTTFPRDWNEFIGLLNAHRVRFLIVGAHALAANGRPRATQDLDIFIDPAPPNVARLGRALQAFGFIDLALEVGRFCEPERMATLGNPPLRIDIMNHIDGVSFAEAWKTRVRARAGDHNVGFLGLAMLRKNKRAAGRTKDLLDLALIDEMERATRRAAPGKKTTRARPRRPR
jgi:hypothetical protein